MAEIGLEKKEIEALDFAFDLGQSEQGQKSLKKKEIFQIYKAYKDSKDLIHAYNLNYKGRENDEPHKNKNKNI